MACSVMMPLCVITLLWSRVAGLPRYMDAAHRRRHQHEHGAVSDATKAKLGAGSDVEVKPHQQASKLSVMQSRYPFYHTTGELRAALIGLSQNCGGALSVKTTNEQNVSIDVITVRRESARPVNRVFILFGEHSRELIGPESGLRFLQTLCGELHPSDVSLQTNSKAADVLEHSEFQIVLNANPRSRVMVEKGDFCLRTNPNGVDLNRNWDENWDGQASFFGSNSNPGPKPFSEPETIIFKKLVTSYAPTTFLTVHSGTRGMYMPWAYDTGHLARYNEPLMMDILKSMDKDHCKCPFGAAGKEVGYPCPGTCLDYAYAKLKTPFVYAFEIYTSHSEDEDLEERWREKMKSGGEELLEKGNHLGHPHFHSFFSKHASDFVGDGFSKHEFQPPSRQGQAPALVRRQPDMMDTSESFVEFADGGEDPNTACFELFNPPSKDDYEKTVDNWAAAYLQMATLIGQKLLAGAVPNKTLSTVM